MRALRAPDQVARLARLGSFHQTRLSFIRVLLRELAGGAWQFDRPVWTIGGDGVVVWADRPSVGDELLYFSLVPALMESLAAVHENEPLLATEWCCHNRRNPLLPVVIKVAVVAAQQVLPTEVSASPCR